MNYYDAQQVCLNGHQITDNYHKYPDGRKDHCDKCGETTIWKCPHCKAEIRGDYVSDAIAFIGIRSAKKVPEFCEKCGKPYPWTERMKAVSKAITSDSTKSAIDLVISVLSRFHLFAKQIRVRHGKRETIDIGDEYDVQDALHAILRLFFDDIRPEEWTPSYAGGSSRIDFLLKNEEIVLEVKMTRKGLGSREVSDQLIIDIERYRKAHPNAKKMICFVYDPEGRISNPKGIENDLSRKEISLDVVVLIVPKGY